MKFDGNPSCQLYIKLINQKQMTGNTITIQPINGMPSLNCKVTINLIDVNLTPRTGGTTFKINFLTKSIEIENSPNITTITEVTKIN